MSYLNRITRPISGRMTLLILLLGIIMSGCDAMHEDLQPCPSGLRLRFVYDYNMEYANAFPSQVDCLILYVFDEEGRRVLSRRAGIAETGDEDWRMILDLAPGRYTCLAYGGMTCDDSSFRFEFFSDTPDLEDIEVSVKPGLIGTDPGHRLHDLFYGRLVVEVPEESTRYTEETVKMMKDTNNIRLVLANTNGMTVNRDDFDFIITCLLYKNDADDE